MVESSGFTYYTHLWEAVDDLGSVGVPNFNVYGCPPEKPLMDKGNYTG